MRACVVRASACVGTNALAICTSKTCRLWSPSLLYITTMQSKLFTASPHSLHHQRLPPEPGPQHEQPSLLRCALLTLGGFYSKESTYMRAAQILYAGVVEQATNPVLMEGVCGDGGQGRAGRGGAGSTGHEPVEAQLMVTGKVAGPGWLAG